MMITADKIITAFKSGNPMTLPKMTGAEMSQLLEDLHQRRFWL
ncbi:hypothetical protein ACN08P_15840 (plasmid) [Photobacterium leiognathi subsp. mandapamensis]